MTTRNPISLFQAFGIELEYMIVDADTLDVRPICDMLFEAATGGSETSDVEPDGPAGTISWSNELVLHVVELKTQRPSPTIDNLSDAFHSNVQRINDLLAPLNARLLPTGMHPWMDPDTQTRLWPHENTEIYRAYDRIFSCKGHGWGNLQSTHINLPFANDEEFGKLYAAIRLVLPLIPALAASSPILEGRISDLANHRMEVYRNNSKRVPMMAGLVIPEPTYTRHSFETDVLGKLYNDLAPLDPEGILRHEFANARGGMARFDRGAIEIRVIDLQESPHADLAIANLVIETVRALVEERWMPTPKQMAVPTQDLHASLLATIRDAEATVITQRDLLDAVGISAPSCPAGEIWKHLAASVLSPESQLTATANTLVEAGTLSTRIRAATGPNPDHKKLREVYRELADTLQRNELFRAD